MSNINIPLNYRNNYNNYNLFNFNYLNSLPFNYNSNNSPNTNNTNYNINSEINITNFNQGYPKNNQGYFKNNKQENNIMIKINKNPCGIINYKNNCYFNSGLQILVTCNKFVEEMMKYKNINNELIQLINDAIYKLLNEEIYDPYNFLKYFCILNNESYISQYCSQSFIRKIIMNINNELIKIGDINYIYENNQYIQNIRSAKQKQIELKKFINYIESNKYFPECKVMKLFSGISKYYSYGICTKCKENIEEYSFSYFLDQNIYLDNMPKSCSFSNLLFNNLGSKSKITIICPKCKNEANLTEETKLINLPEILIFTLERYKEGFNDILVIPDEFIDITNYLDDSIKLINTKYEYELFAINIRFGQSIDSGHEICQVKRNGIWYEINDTSAYKRNKTYNNNSYGLFYQRKYK